MEIFYVIIYVSSQHEITNMNFLIILNVSQNWGGFEECVSLIVSINISFIDINFNIIIVIIIYDYDMIIYSLFI